MRASKRAQALAGRHHLNLCEESQAKRVAPLRVLRHGGDSKLALRSAKRPSSVAHNARPSRHAVRGQLEATPFAPDTCARKSTSSKKQRFLWWAEAPRGLTWAGSPLARGDPSTPAVTHCELAEGRALKRESS